MIYGEESCEREYLIKEEGGNDGHAWAMATLFHTSSLLFHLFILSANHCIDERAN
jgi:hypothetical protein